MADACLICGGETRTESESYAGFQAPERFRIVSCATCGVSYSLPRVDASKVYDNIYRSAREIPGYTRYWKFMEEIGGSADPLGYLAGAEDVYWGVAQAFRRIGAAERGARCLEVGSGLGYLTYALSKSGVDIRGLDLSDVAVQNARRRFGDLYESGDVFRYAEKHAGSFDVVLLTEVIEHVDDPVEFLGALRRLVRPGGAVILTTPNKTFFPAKVVWVSTPPPVHCWWFGEDTVEWMARRHGLEASFVDFSEFHGPGGSIDISAPLDYVILGPVLGEDGRLVAGRKLRNLVRGIPLVMPIYRKLSGARREREPLALGRRGPTLCAILAEPGKAA